MPAYIHRYYLFADAAGAAWVRGMFQQMGGDRTGLACKTPLSPINDPTADPVYWCCSFPATEEQRRMLENVEDAGQIPSGVFYARADAIGAEEGVVRASNHPWGKTRIGKVWNMETVLTTLQLAFHTPPNA
jgi:hypothetical protein